MSICLTATVYGPPATQGSKRAFVNPKTGRAILVEDSATSRPWRSQMQHAMLAAVDVVTQGAPQGRPPFGNEVVFVTLTVLVTHPRSHYGTGKNAHQLKAATPAKWCASGTDLDKVQRAVGDAGNGIWWDDDSRCFWLSRRAYTDGTPRTEVTARNYEPLNWPANL